MNLRRQTTPSIASLFPPQLIITKGSGEIGPSQAEKILQIIAGPDRDNIVAQSHGKVERIYGSLMEGFTATLESFGL